jgi:transcriptional regulator with XRE-family HTH domain
MTRAPSTGDVEVGRRVRVFRLQRQMTQTTLGERLGLTFQQIQKYENGTNRIGAGRLQVIAEVLEVPVAAFFDRPATKGSSKPLLDFIDTAASLRLLRAFERMENSAVRNAFVKLAESVAGDVERPA